MHDQQVDVAIIGGGIIGLSIAWRLGQRGRSVVIVEKGRLGRGASWAAAGMLSPAAEIGFEELNLYRFGRESLKRWPQFARELEEASGQSVGYRDEGTLVVAADRDDTEALQRLFRFQLEQGVPVKWLAGSEALEIEPMLAPGLPAAIFSPEDHQVDNREVVEALVKVIREMEELTVFENNTVKRVEILNKGVRLTVGDSREFFATIAINAAGAWSRDLGGIRSQLPVRPVKGQILSLRMKEGFELNHVIRGPSAYLVPKTDSRLVIGATSEELGFDAKITAGGVYRLLEGAVEVVPGVEELEILETSVGHRPVCRDHAPLIGWLAPRIMAATGHYRHGILLTPITADEVTCDVDARLDGNAETSEWLAPFSPTRFE